MGSKIAITAGLTLALAFMLAAIVATTALKTAALQPSASMETAPSPVPFAEHATAYRSAYLAAPGWAAAPAAPKLCAYKRSTSGKMTGASLEPVQQPTSAECLAAWNCAADWLPQRV